MRRALSSVLAVLLGVVLGLTITWIAGENPGHVLAILVRGACGTRYDIGMTLFYSTPLIFTGLSVAVALQAGLFNIGGEGQLTAGALATATVGAVLTGLPGWIGPWIGGLAALLAGGLWGAIPGWLRAKRGSHEVITTIMLNFIAAGLASYVVLYLIKNPASQNPESQPIGAGFLLKQFAWFDGAPVSVALPIALVTALLVWVLLERSVLGFEMRAVGQSESAAEEAGINVGKIQVLALTIAGALAGLVGLGEVMGNAGKFKVGFSPEYGFMGIAVALAGRNHPLGVIAAALLFGALHKGTADLDLDTEHVTREMSMVLQALIILSVSAEGLWSWMHPRRRRSVPGPGGPTGSREEAA